MIKKMRRFKQQLSDEQCKAVLTTETRGVLSLIDANGYPYGIPMNHWYCEEDGKLYFHGAKQGHKIDLISNCNKVSYTVFDKGYRKNDEWALNVKSVIVVGEIRLVTDIAKATKICAGLCQKFTDDETYLAQELEKSLNQVQCLELTPKQITGKLVNES